MGPLRSDNTEKGSVPFGHSSLLAGLETTRLGRCRKRSGDGVEERFVSAFPRIRRAALQNENPFACPNEIAFQEIPVASPAVEGDRADRKIAAAAITLIEKRSVRHFPEKLLGVPGDETGERPEFGWVYADLQAGFAVRADQVRTDQVSGKRVSLYGPALRVTDGKAVMTVAIEIGVAGMNGQGTEQDKPDPCKPAE